MVKQTIELEVPEGWRLTGEFRKAKKGEWYLTNNNEVFQAEDDHFIFSLIVERDVMTLWVVVGHGDCYTAFFKDKEKAIKYVGKAVDQFKIIKVQEVPE
jgi:hypothetical protein